MIERWLGGRRGRRAPRTPALGFELAACGRLIKGYGATNERGKANLLPRDRPPRRRDAIRRRRERAAAIRASAPGRPGRRGRRRARPGAGAPRRAGAPDAGAADPLGRRSARARPARRTRDAAELSRSCRRRPRTRRQGRSASLRRRPKYARRVDVARHRTVAIFIRDEETMTHAPLSPACRARAARRRRGARSRSPRSPPAPSRRTSRSPLKLSSWVPAQHPLNPALIAWAADITKASNGTHHRDALSVRAARQGLRPLRHGQGRHRRPRLHQPRLPARALPGDGRRRPALHLLQRQGRLGGDRRLVPAVRGARR